MKLENDEKKMEKDSIESRIRILQSRLDASTSDIGDWKIIRIYEARFNNEPDPYNFNELISARKKVRNEIQKLQDIIKDK